MGVAPSNTYANRPDYCENLALKVLNLHGLGIRRIEPTVLLVLTKLRTLFMLVDPL